MLNSSSLYNFLRKLYYEVALFFSTRILDKTENKYQESKHWIEVLTNLSAENRNKKSCLKIIEYSLLIIIYFLPDKELYPYRLNLTMQLLLF